MKFLKNRKTAILITVIVAALATLIGVRRTTVRLTQKIEAMFYDGVYLESEGYTQPSINSQLDRIVTVSLNIATLIQDRAEFESETAALIETRRELLSAKSIFEKKRAFFALDYSYIELHTKIEKSADLSEREIAAITQHFQTYEGASSYIKGTLAPSYNSKVDDFFAERSFIAALFSSAAPDYFY